MLIVYDTPSAHWRVFSLLAAILFLQTACSYTSVYDSAPQEIPEVEASGSADSDTSTAAPTTPRVAVVSPQSIESGGTRTHTSSAAAKLRGQAADAVEAGETVLAQRLLDRALRIAPRDPNTYLQLGQLKAVIGRY